MSGQDTHDEQGAELDIGAAHPEATVPEVVDAAEVQRRLLAIEEERHAWEVQRGTEEAERARQVEEHSKTAEFDVTFGYRDSGKTWGRVIARNGGPADARDVTLDIWWEQDEGRAQVDRMRGQDYGESESLRPGEAVRIGIAFSFETPALEELRYRLMWTDERGNQDDEGRVPVP